MKQIKLMTQHGRDVSKKENDIYTDIIEVYYRHLK